MHVNRLVGLGVVAMMMATTTLAVEDSTLSSLNLAECIDRGVEGNRMLQLQRLQLSSASADVQRVRAVYDTRLQLNGTWEDSDLPAGSFPSQGGFERGQLTGRLFRDFSYGTRLGVQLDTQRNYFEGLQPEMDPTWRTTASLFLRQSLWKNAMGGSDRARVDYEKKRLQSLELEYQRSREEVAAQIADLYWAALIARGVVNAQESVVHRLAALYEDYRKKVEDGLLDETALLAVEASLAVAEVDIEVLRYEAAALDERLKEKIDLPARAWDFTTIDYTLPTGETDTIAASAFVEVMEQALVNRADVEALRREEQRVESLIRLRRLDDRSDLEVSGSIGRGDTDTTWSETGDFDRTVWSIGLSLDMSLNRSGTKADLAQAYLERDRIRLEREMLERAIELDARAAIRQSATAQRLVHATRRALDAQIRKLDREMVRFDRGQTDTKTRLDYQNDRDLAERDYLKALGAHERAKVALRLVQGTLMLGSEK